MCNSALEHDEICLGLLIELPAFKSAAQLVVLSTDFRRLLPGRHAALSGDASVTFCRAQSGSSSHL
jgi:hypothetical protein